MLNLSTVYTKERRDLSDARNLIKFDKVLPLFNEKHQQVFPAEITFARFGVSAATDWMQANGYDGRHLIEISHGEGRKADSGAQWAMNQITEEGFVLDVDEEQRIYRVFGQGASGARTCTTVFAPLKFQDKFLTWYACGEKFKELLLSRMPLEKIWVYNMQAFSSSTIWNNSFPSRVLKYMPEPMVDRVMVFKEDLELVHGMKEVTSVSAAVVEKIQLSLKETDSDGLVLYLIDDLNLSDGEKEELDALIVSGLIQAFSIRAPGAKGLAVPVLKSTIKQIMDEYSETFVLPNGTFAEDFFGDKWRLEDVDMIWFPSSFKWSKVTNKKPDWEMYKKGFKEMGHQIRVCKQSHPGVDKRLPTQECQAIIPDEQAENTLKNISINMLKKHVTMEGALSLITNPWIRKTAAVWPTLMSEINVFSEIQSRHVNQTLQSLTGCIPNTIRYTFCAPDMLPIICHLIGAPIHYLLEEGQMNVNMGKIKDPVTGKYVPYCPFGEKVMVMRNPCPGLGIMTNMNVSIPKKYRGLYIGNTAFISVRGLDMRTLSMDYDGDTVGVMSLYWDYAKDYKRSLDNAQEVFDYKTVYFKNASPKTPYTYSDYCKMIAYERPSEVGLVINGITRLLDVMMANGMTDEQKTQFSILEAASTLIIDAAKNGDNKEIKKTIDEAEVILDKVRRYPAPMHTFWKKKVRLEDIELHDYDLDRVVQDCMPYYRTGEPMFVRRDNWMGRYTKAIQEEVPGKIPVDKWAEEGLLTKWVYSTDRAAANKSRDMMINGPAKNLNGLFSYSEHQYENGKVDWNKTLFGSIVGEFISMKEAYKNGALMTEAVKEALPRWKESVYTFGARNGLSKDETLARLVHTVYLHNDNISASKKIICSDVKNVLWTIFGEEIYTNVCNNLGLKADGKDVDWEAEEEEFVDFEEDMFFDDEFDYEDGGFYFFDE